MENHKHKETIAQREKKIRKGKGKHCKQETAQHSKQNPFSFCVVWGRRALPPMPRPGFLSSSRMRSKGSRG